MCWIGAVPSEGGRNRHCSYVHMHMHETHRTNACRSEEIELQCFVDVHWVRGMPLNSERNACYMGLPHNA